MLLPSIFGRLLDGFGVEVTVTFCFGGGFGASFSGAFSVVFFVVFSVAGGRDGCTTGGFSFSGFGRPP